MRTVLLEHPLRGAYVPGRPQRRSLILCSESMPRSRGCPRLPGPELRAPGDRRHRRRRGLEARGGASGMGGPAEEPEEEEPEEDEDEEEEEDQFTAEDFDEEVCDRALSPLGFLIFRISERLGAA